jgi:eukaryotic-like serine/threonine-protein kinase
VVGPPVTSCPSCGRPQPADGSPCPACTLPTARPHAVGAAAPAVAGRYLMQRLLGRGSAKEVWLAHDLTLDRPVALSRVKGAGPEARERVRREARLMARLGDHPQVVTVHDVIDDAGSLLIVARYMAGGSLTARLAAAPGHRLPVPDVVRVGAELAAALAHAHEHGVVHRDVKPDNIWLAGDGGAALGDFGIALSPDDASVVAGALTGTPLYMAPEQAHGRGVGPHSDLYALGATLYELLCGRPPFTGDTDAVVEQHLGAAPVPPSRRVAGVPAALDALVLALLAKEPTARPASAAAVRDRLGGGRAPRTETMAAGEAEPLIGRTSELARLDALAAAADRGEPRVAALAGEAGIGKTRLATAVAEDAGPRGAEVLWGRAAEEAAAFAPWQPLLHALRGPAGGDADLARLAEGGAVGGPEDRLRLFDAVARELERRAAERTLVVVLEDLHWADASSLALLRHVVGALRGARVLLLVTHRPGEGAARPLAGLEQDPRCEELVLRGLGEDDVRRLLPPEHDAADIAAAVHRRTGGNPFFARELVRLLEAEGGGRAHLDAVPGSVRDVVARRVDALSEPARRALAAGAVLGRAFGIGTLGRLVGDSPAAAADAVDEAVAAELLVEAPTHPGRHDFAHGIVRDAVYGRLGRRERTRLHAAAAALLRDGAGGDATAADLAHHSLLAARGGLGAEDAWGDALAAAREAEGVLAHEEAQRYYAQALEACELGAAPPEAARAAAIAALAAACLGAGDVEGSRRRHRQAAALARRRGDAEALATAALGFAHLQPYGDVDRDAIGLLQEALDEQPPEDSPARAALLALLALRSDPVTAQHEREALVQEAVAMAARLGDDRTAIGAHVSAGMVEWRPERAHRRRAAVEEVLRLSATARDDDAVLFARTHRFADALRRGDGGAMDAELDRCAAVVRETRHRHHDWWLLVLRTCRAVHGGRLEEADGLIDAGVTCNRSLTDDFEQEASVQRLVLSTLRWRPQEAPLAALRGYAARYPRLPVWEALVAAAEWARGDAAAARRSLDVCLGGGLAAIRRTPDWLVCLSILADPVAGAGRPDERKELLALLEPHAAVNPCFDDPWVAWGPVARGAGLLAAAVGEGDRAAAHLAAAVELAARWGAPAWELRATGDWLRSGAPTPDRAALVARVLALARELELPWVAARFADAVT